MLRSSVALALILTSASPLAAAPPPNPQIDYPGFQRLTTDVRAYRETRLIDWNTFLSAATDPDVLILDARSERQFAQGHLAGAVNVPLPEFSEERLAEVIGTRNRPILIYCNNNFINDRPPVMSKAMPLALNIQTFIHLVGYGYPNVRELNDVIDIDDPRIPWVSSAREAAASSASPSRAR